MRIDITDVCKEDASPIKRALKKAFGESPPAVVIQDTRAAKAFGLTIPVRVSKGPARVEDQVHVSAAIDNVLVHHGYILSNISHA